MNSIPIIDSHCHLDFAAFDQDRERVLSNCQTVGVNNIVVPGVLANSWESLLSWSKRSTAVHCALGLHPVFLEQHQEEHLHTLDHLLKDNQVIAVGEIGLDFFIKKADIKKDHEKQIYFFKQQLSLAKKHDLPVILHTRKSHDATLQLLKKYQPNGGIAHAFSGSMQQAKQYLDLGFKLGFGGMLTFERSRKLRQLAKELPLDAIVLETDSPDMTVEQHRGERNSPEYLPYALAALTSIRAESADKIATQTYENTRSVLALPL